MEGPLSRHHARVIWEEGKGDLRAHRIELAAQSLPGSSAPELGGDPLKADPEEMFVASLSACHMLWFLALARRRRLRVRAYSDEAEGVLDGRRITRVELRPRVEFEDDPGGDALAELHHDAHELCFIANSVSCSVEVAHPDAGPGA